MSKDKNQKDYYLNVKGQKIAVTEEVYRAYCRPAWAEKKRRERENRCRTADGNRCNGNCGQCAREPDGGILSLDKFLEEGCEAADPTAVEELAMERLLLEELAAALEELTDDERSLIDNLYYKEKSERQVSMETGVPRKTLAYRKEKILAKLKKILGD